MSGDISSCESLQCDGCTLHLSVPLVSEVPSHVSLQSDNSHHTSGVLLSDQISSDDSLDLYD